MGMMKSSAQAATGRPVVAGFADLTRLIQRAEGFHPLVAALKNGHGATVDGAWGSSASLSAAALGLQAPRTLLVAVAHPRDVDAWADDIETFTGQRPTVFPAWEAMPEAGDAKLQTSDSKFDVTAGVDEIAGQRLRVLKSLAGSNSSRFLLTTIQALLQPVPDRAQLAARRRILRKGESVNLEELTAWLVEHHFHRTEIVSLPGEFSRRGGILDIFSPDADAPCRLEFFGDEVDSIRQFSPETQRSLGDVLELEITATVSPRNAIRGLEAIPHSADTGHFCEHLSPDAWTALVEPDDLQDQGKHYLDRIAQPRGLFSVTGAFQQLLRFPNVRISALPIASVEETCHLRVESVERFSGDVTKVRGELESIAAGNQIVIACHNEAEAKRLAEVLGSTVQLLVGKIRAGFRLVDAGIVVLSDHELFHREESRPIQPRRRLESRAIDSFLDLAEDDLVVHVSHGIARYRGMQLLEKHEHREEHLILEFRDSVRVYVPVSKIDLVQKYVGGSRTEPELSKYGGTSWQNKKDKVEAAVIDMAGDMVELQALRQAQPGFALPPDTEWQSEFEAAFPFQETPDQLSTIGEIKRDMERTRPMDRLICGDVGYGKTELAIRAAFKTVDNGKQVAVLVPTTVLAEQHFRTFSQRLAEYPFVVECISRFRTGSEQRNIIERLSGGGIDIIIGTHRLVSADVKFKDLGLVIIDEEQRFGVEHKERLKRLRQQVDVLTMTATPIPRTLHLALLGIRDISNLETPPADRLAIETRISRFDPDLIRHAILRELNRD
jgi:transcription-repair coupling factor (superfamily II helicase)